MQFERPKTKIVCTIGPASREPKTLENLMRSGLDVARLNFAHGDLAFHRENIRRLRAAGAKVGKTVAILADLPGPKIRIGKLLEEPLSLSKNDEVHLIVGRRPQKAKEIPCELVSLPRLVQPGRLIYLNDGFIQLEVRRVRPDEVLCRVLIGGTLVSRKGLNIPGATLPVQAVTKADLNFVQFGLKEGIDGFGISFVESAADIEKVRRFAARQGKHPFLIAKIEREGAVRKADEILQAADGLMVARGDLGVEIPLEQVPIVQKLLIRKANFLAKPVITATQMLESMVENIRPTRAEATDVANAVFDGTDALMLSAETAVGKYPVETVQVMASIALTAERERPALGSAWNTLERWRQEHFCGNIPIKDEIALHAAETLEHIQVRHLVAPTLSGDTARRISRFRPACWILAFTNSRQVERTLAFSGGVQPIFLETIENQREKQIIRYLKSQGIAKAKDCILLTEGSRIGIPAGTNTLKIITLD